MDAIRVGDAWKLCSAFTRVLNCTQSVLTLAVVHLACPMRRSACGAAPPSASGWLGAAGLEQYLLSVQYVHLSQSCHLLDSSQHGHARCLSGLPAPLLTAGAGLAEAFPMGAPGYTGDLVPIPAAGEAGLCSYWSLFWLLRCAAGARSLPQQLAGHVPAALRCPHCMARASYPAQSYAQAVLCVVVAGHAAVGLASKMPNAFCFLLPLRMQEKAAQSAMQDTVAGAGSSAEASAAAWGADAAVRRRHAADPSGAEFGSVVTGLRAMA